MALFEAELAANCKVENCKKYDIHCKCKECEQGYELEEDICWFIKEDSGYITTYKKFKKIVQEFNPWAKRNVTEDWLDSLRKAAKEKFPTFCNEED